MSVLKRTKVATIYQNDDFGQDASAGLETGLTSPITFAPNQHAGSQSVNFMRAKDRKWSIGTEWMEAN